MPKNTSIGAHLTPIKLLKSSGFTTVELMITIVIVGILTALAAPSLNELLIRMRVDNEITEMQRLLLTARNTAINTGRNTTICPLNSANTCINDWTGIITVFVNDDNIIANNATYTPATEEIIKVKNAISVNDKLQFTTLNVIYTPTGRIVTNAVVGSFNYCPNEYTNSSRAITLSPSGRVYSSADIDNDGKDEDRNGNEITCS